MSHKKMLLGVVAALLQTYAIGQPLAPTPRYEAPDEVVEEGQIAKLRSNGAPVTGTVFYLSLFTGNLAKEFSYKDGLRHGVSKVLNEQGIVILQMEWQNGHAEGLTREFYSSGKKESERTYAHSEMEGLYQEWYETGELRIRGSFSKSQKTGQWTYFEKDGTIKELLSFEKGILQTTILSLEDIEQVLSARKSANSANKDPKAPTNTAP